MKEDFIMVDIIIVLGSFNVEIAVSSSSRRLIMRWLLIAVFYLMTLA